MLKTSGVATKAEMDDLKAQIAELKEMLAGTHKPADPPVNPLPSSSASRPDTLDARGAGTPLPAVRPLDASGVACLRTSTSTGTARS